MLQKALAGDGAAVSKLAVKLWPGHSAGELEKGFEELIGKRDAAVFVYKIEDTLVGFAQCGLRYDYVEGTESSPVGYLEGIFIEEAFRGKGHAKTLLEGCERWAREQGCMEFASDCEISNLDSLRFHINHGFTEANRIICFTKKL